MASAEGKFGTGRPNNYGEYSSQVVDDLFAQLHVTTDAASSRSCSLETEQNLWADAFGVVLFQFPA